MTQGPRPVDLTTGIAIQIKERSSTNVKEIAKTALQKINSDGCDYWTV